MRQLSDLLARTQEIIERGREAYPLGVTCWSGGKDSMVLLHLLRQSGACMPVVFFREPWQPRKYAFHDQLIRDWELQILSWHPSAVAFQQDGDEFELQSRYQIGLSDMTCPTGITPPDEGLSWACAVDMSCRATQERLDVFPHPQALWIGHKRCDSDPILGGDAGTRVEALVREDGTAVIFPLRDWTHDDVWTYIEEFEVPYDSARYEKHEGVWRERPDRRHNADYVHACTACIDRRPDAPQFVHCPKLQMTIENCSSRLPWVEPRKLSYMEDQAISPS
jgi:hypothetical protein